MQEIRKTSPAKNSPVDPAADAGHVCVSEALPPSRARRASLPGRASGSPPVFRNPDRSPCGIPAGLRHTRPVLRLCWLPHFWESAAP
jgi:hypothetical protein